MVCLRPPGEPCHRSTGGGQDQAGPLGRAFAQGQDRKGPARAGHIHLDIQPLTHGKAEAAAGQRQDGRAIDRDKTPGQNARIDPEHRGGGSVDDADKHPAALVDRHRLGIVKRAVVGEIGVESIVVQIHAPLRHAPLRHAPHVVHPPLTRLAVVHPGHPGHRGAAGDLGQHLGRRLEGEVVQQKRHLLPVGRQILGPAHDQRRGQQPHLVLGNMGMHPMRAGARREVIGAGFAGGEDRHRQAGHAVLGIGRDLPVPMDERRFVEGIGQIDRKGLAGIENKAGAAVAVAQPPDGRGLALHVDGAAGGRQRHPRGSGPDPGGKDQQSGRGRRGGQKVAARGK